jgi:hypothetical protein
MMTLYHKGPDRPGWQEEEVEEEEEPPPGDRHRQVDARGRREGGEKDEGLRRGSQGLGSSSKWHRARPPETHVWNDSFHP